MPKPTKEELYEALYELGLTPKQAAIKFRVTYGLMRQWIMEFDLGARAVARQLARKLKQ